MPILVIYNMAISDKDIGGLHNSLIWFRIEISERTVLFRTLPHSAKIRTSDIVCLFIY